LAGRKFGEFGKFGEFDIISSGFKKSGICPFDLDAIYYGSAEISSNERGSNDVSK